MEGSEELTGGWADRWTGGWVDGWMGGWAYEHTLNVPVEQYVSYQVYHILSLLS